MNDANKLANIKTSKEILDKKYNKTGLYILYPFIGLLIALFGFLALGKKEVVIDGFGRIDTSNMEVAVVPDITSTITKIFVSNNENVEEGDTILTLDSTIIEEKIDSIKDTIEKNRKEIVYLNLFKKSVEDNQNLMEDDYLGYQNLYEAYLVKLKQLELTIKEHDNNKALVSESLQLQKNNINTRISYENSIINDYSVFIKIINYDITEYSISNIFVSNEIQMYFNNIFDIKNSVLHSTNEETQVDHADQGDQANQANQVDQIDVDYEIQKLKIETLNNAEQRIVSSKNTISDLNDSLVIINQNIKTNDTTTESSLLNIDSLKIETINNIESKKIDLLRANDDLDVELEQLDSDLQNYSIYAKTSGKISLVENLILGSSVSEGAPIAKITNGQGDGEAFLVAHIPSADIVNVEKGQEIRFKIDSTADARNKTYDGYISSIAVEPTQLETSFYYKIECRFNDKIELQNGISGKVSVVVEKTTYLRAFLNLIFK